MGEEDRLAALQQRVERLTGALREADSLLDCTDFALEWFFEKFDDPKHFQCDCSEDGGYMEWDTNAYIHTERCSSGRDDSLGALKDQIGQWRQQARAALADAGLGVEFTAAEREAILRGSLTVPRSVVERAEADGGGQP